MLPKRDFSPLALWAEPDQQKIKLNLKIWGFLAAWLAIPVVLGSFFLASPAKLRQAEIYQGETQPLAAPNREVKLAVKVKFKGVQTAAVASQSIFIQGVDEQKQLSFSFASLPVVQDKNDPEVFQGQLSLAPELLEGVYTLWVKGPVHLQRRFDGLVVSATGLDLTQKPLLAGDLLLPDTGPDDRVDELDRDYLWSLLAKQDRKPTAAEIKAADLDLDARLTGRDQSLLIDTGVGMEGEK